MRICTQFVFTTCTHHWTGLHVAMTMNHQHAPKKWQPRRSVFQFTCRCNMPRLSSINWHVIESLSLCTPKPAVCSVWGRRGRPTKTSPMIVATITGCGLTHHSSDKRRDSYSPGPTPFGVLWRQKSNKSLIQTKHIKAHRFNGPQSQSLDFFGHSTVSQARPSLLLWPGQSIAPHSPPPASGVRIRGARTRAGENGRRTFSSSGWDERIWDVCTTGPPCPLVWLGLGLNVDQIDDRIIGGFSSNAAFANPHACIPSPYHGPCVQLACGWCKTHLCASSKMSLHHKAPNPFDTKT